MKQIHVIFLIVLLILLSGCGGFYITTKILPSGKVLDTSFNQQVNYENRYDLIVVNARVNGSEEEFEFIFDTGASITVFSKTTADKLGLKPVSSYKIGDANQTKQDMGLLVVDEISIGGIRFEEIGVGIVEFPENSSVECVAKDGIIGMDLIRHCNWHIDFQNRQLTLTDDTQSNGDLENSYIVPFIKHRNRPKINVKLNGVEFDKVLVDLGSTGSVDLPASVLEQYPELFDNLKPAIYFDGTTQSLWGNKLDTVQKYTVNSIGLAGLTSDTVIIDVESSSGKKIGNEFWTNYSMIFDFENDNIILSPILGRDKVKRLHGFGMVMKYVDNGKLQIGSVYKPSPAYTAGLKPGDEIIEINKKPVNEYFSDYCSCFFWQRQFLKETDKLILKVLGVPETITLTKGFYSPLKNDE